MFCLVLHSANAEGRKSSVPPHAVLGLNHVTRSLNAAETVREVQTDGKLRALSRHGYRQSLRGT